MRGTVTSTMRRAAHQSGCARCGAGADCLAIRYPSLDDISWKFDFRKGNLMGSRGLTSRSLPFLPFPDLLPPPPAPHLDPLSRAILRGYPTKSALVYRGTSLVTNRHALGHDGRPIRRPQAWSLRGGAFSCDPGTSVAVQCQLVCLAKVNPS